MMHIYYATVCFHFIQEVNQLHFPFAIMKDLLLFCLTTAASALPDARGDRVHRRDVPLPYPQHQQASLARRSTGRANGRDQTSPARSLVRRGVGELKAGQIGGAYPHMQDNVIGSDYFNWLPHNLDAEAKCVWAILSPLRAM